MIEEDVAKISCNTLAKSIREETTKVQNVNVMEKKVPKSKSDNGEHSNPMANASDESSSNMVME